MPDSQDSRARIAILDKMLVKLKDAQQRAECVAADALDRAAQIAHQVRMLSEESRRLRLSVDAD